jgi:4'-phosphopantetheinyl transferase
MADISIWVITASERIDPDDLRILAADEQARAGRFRRSRDAAAYVATRAAARRILAPRLGVDPDELIIGRADCPGCGSPTHGPPRIVAPATHLGISLSRTGRTGLVAISPETEVGVDVETIPTSTTGIPRSVLTQRECSHLDDLPEYEQTAAFCRCWVRKEAVTKAAGVGIVGNLAALEVNPQVDGGATVRHTILGLTTREWRVRDVVIGPGLAAAVAFPARWGADNVVVQLVGFVPAS